MIQLVDLFDSKEVEIVKQDLIQECKVFGDIISIEIPLPNMSTSSAEIVEGERLANTALVTRAHGKIFVKFSHIVSAK